MSLASAFVVSSPMTAGGANQAGVRLYNERLLLSLVRRFGPLSKIEVARLTGLSVQATSAIMNRLQAEGLLSGRPRSVDELGSRRSLCRSNPKAPFLSGSKSDDAAAIWC